MVKYTNGSQIGWVTDNKEWWLMDLTPFTCGIPQGLVLGPVVITYINDVDVGLDNLISKFAHNTKT